MSDPIIEAMARPVYKGCGDGFDECGRLDREFGRCQCRSTAREIRAALEAAGYAIVPREPTLAMMRAADNAPDYADDIYRAMIAAAPGVTPARAGDPPA